MLQTFYHTKRICEIRDFPKDGRAVLGDYSGGLLHCLFENPVLPTIPDAFKINMEWETDKMENYLCSCAASVKDEALTPLQQESIIHKTLCSDITNLTTRS